MEARVVMGACSGCPLVELWLTFQCPPDVIGRLGICSFGANTIWGGRVNSVTVGENPRPGRNLNYVAHRVDNRKDFLLLVLAASGEEPVVGVTRLQKYMFLLQQQYGWDAKFAIAEPYEFRAYDYGPFDAQIYDDLQFFQNIGFVEASEDGPEPVIERDELRRASDDWGVSDSEVKPWDETSEVLSYRLTDKGKQFVSEIELDEADRNTVEALKSEWNRKPLRDLLKWLYQSYPKFAENTVLGEIKP